MLLTWMGKGMSVKLVILMVTYQFGILVEIHPAFFRLLKSVIAKHCLEVVGSGAEDIAMGLELSIPCLRE